MISTRDLTQLPNPQTLIKIMQSLALLDSIMCSEWEDRYFSYNSTWSKTEQMASMRNGSGDDLFAVFENSGCFLRGFDHESTMSPWKKNPSKIWAGVLENIPARFASSVNEPAFHMEDTTFCIWHHGDEEGWTHGPIDFPNEDEPDGSKWMLSMLDGDPNTYQTFAKEYFEIELALETISRVLAHEPLSLNLLQSFPSTFDQHDVVLDAREIGYPIDPEMDK